MPINETLEPIFFNMYFLFYYCYFLLWEKRENALWAHATSCDIVQSTIGSRDISR